MPKILKSILIFLCVGIIISLKIVPARSALNYCQVSNIDPSNISPGASGSLSFNVHNGGYDSIVWLKITSPSSNFIITGGNSSGWSTSTTDSAIIFTGGNQPNGNLFGYNVDVLASSTATQEGWVIEASDSIDGSGAITCQGNTQVAISDNPADTSAPEITSSITVTGVSDTSVTLSWTTDESSTSTINFGLTDSYGSSKSETSPTTNHSITINSLTSNTTYHFNIVSVDMYNNQSTSDDSTFVITRGATTTLTNTVTNTVTNTSTITKTITKEIRDEIKPISKLLLDFKKIYNNAPEITGTATDDGGIAYVLYSVDDGKNYIPANILGKVGSKSVTFKFTPEIKDDGNYKTRIKTIDSSGNEQISALNELIIDRLPPRPTGTLFYVGPLLLPYDTEGYTKLMLNTPVKILLSAVGGPISIDLVANDKVFTLTKNIDTGLWSGNISFDKVGEFNLIANSLDGANNQTVSLVGKIKVIDNGHTTPDSNLSVFVFDNISSKFVLWNGEPYDIANPQMVDENGNYKLILPNGKYYIEVNKKGYKPLRTKIFNLENGSYINSTFTLEKKKYFWDIFSTHADVEIIEQDKSLDIFTIQSGKYLPDFSIEGLNNTNLLGKPSLLTIITPWMPNTNEQLIELQKIKENHKNSEIFVVAEEQTVSGLLVFKKLGGYDLNFYPDRDGELYTKFGLVTLPTHIFLNRQGIVKNVISGFLPSDEISKNLLD